MLSVYCVLVNIFSFGNLNVADSTIGSFLSHGSFVYPLLILSLKYYFSDDKLNILFPDCRRVVEKYYSLDVAINSYKKILNEINYN